MKTQVIHTDKVLIYLLGAPNGPQTPTRSERPGEPVALLDFRYTPR
jgi:hypothetical protein